MEVFDHLQPHLNEFIVHSILIREEIMGEVDNIIGNIVLEEGFLQAVLLQRVSLCIASEVYFEWGREAERSYQPIRESLATESFTVEVMMSIQ
jgi:hypothetical protein